MNDNYSIQKSYKPLMLQIMTVIFVSDVLFVFLILLLVGVRNVLGLDASLVAFTVLLFCVKTAITVYGAYTTMRNWLGVSYFVNSKRLAIQSDIRQAASSVWPLKDLRSVKVDDSYVLFRKTDYGDIHLNFSSGAAKQDVYLRNVKNPTEVAGKLSKNMQG